MDLERIGDISRYPKLLPPNPDHIWCIWCWRNREKGLLPRCEYLVCCNLRHSEPVMCMVGTVYSVLYSGATWFVTASYHPKWKGSIQFDRMPQAPFLSIIVALLGRSGTGSGQGSPLSTGTWELYELSALHWMNPVSTEANQSATSFLNWPDTALNDVECTAPPYRLNFPLALFPYGPLSPYGLGMVHGLMGWFSGCSPFPVTRAAWAPSSKRRASRTIRRSFFRCFSP